MKKLLPVVLAVLMVAVMAVGCQAKAPTASPVASEGPAASGGYSVQLGMVTDAGTIDDKSFNQGTWTGIQQAATEFGLKSQYLKPVPAEPTEADYLAQIQNLYDGGYKFIETPGFKFSTAIFKAQDKYKDAKFVIIDAAPSDPADPEGKPVVGPNTVSIFFAEHESGFVAGVAAALQLKEGDFGFIGGMQIPAVQKFNWGFQQGVDYANKNLGTTVTMKPENVVYSGSFSDVAKGGQLAAAMFDKGVKAIFCAAGGVGVGAINEAVNRAKAGKEAWIIGVDVDQYDSGIYDEANKKSVILTSAMKGVTQAAYEMIKQDKAGTFPGGQTLTYNAKNGGVGIPATNPNLTKEVTDKVATVFKDLQDGKITVADKADGLIEPKG